MKEQPANPVALCSGFTGSEAWRRGGVATEPMSAASLHRKKTKQDERCKILSVFNISSVIMFFSPV